VIVAEQTWVVGLITTQRHVCQVVADQYVLLVNCWHEFVRVKLDLQATTRDHSCSKTMGGSMVDLLMLLTRHGMNFDFIAS
jgi:hypothetical protein